MGTRTGEYLRIRGAGVLIVGTQEEIVREVELILHLAVEQWSDWESLPPILARIHPIYHAEPSAFYGVPAGKRELGVERRLKSVGALKVLWTDNVTVLHRGVWHEGVEKEILRVGIL